MNQNVNFDAIAKYYDLLYANRDEDLKMWLSLTAAIDGNLLELGCGTGRITIPLLQADKQITGVDISKAALKRLKHKLSTSGLVNKASLHHGDMRSLNLPHKNFAFAFIPINTFMHNLTTTDQQATLRAVYNHLRPRGTLVVDLYHPHLEALMEADGRMLLADQFVDEITGNSFQWYVIRKLHLDEQIQEVTFIIDETLPDNTISRHTFTFPMRYLHRFEAELLLRSAGFTIQQLYGDYDQLPFYAQSPRLIYIAQKQ